MPKTAVQTAVCDICGAEVRQGSMYCYNCGGSVADSAAAEDIPAAAEPIAAVRAEDHSNGAARAVDPKPEKLRRADRHKVRAANRQPVEIVWEPRSGVSLVFIIASIVFLVLALAIVAAAFYLR